MSATIRNRFLLTAALLLTVLFLGQIKAEAAVATMPAKVTSDGSNEAVVSWKKVSGASRYEIWMSECNGLEQYTKVASLKRNSTSYTLKGLSANNCYKLRVYAKKKNGKKIASSKLLHFVTAGNTEYTNIRKVTLNADAVSVKVGKTKKVKASCKREDKNRKLLGVEHVSRKIRYFSTNKKIATVSSGGVITGKKKGNCTVYAIAKNGVWDSVKVTVTAKKKTSKPSTPEEQPTLSGSAGDPSTPAETPAAPVQTPAEEKYILSYSFTGNVPGGVKKPKSVKLSKGDKISAPAITAPEGYSFSGWTMSGDGAVPAVMPGEDVELVGVFSKNSHKLTVKHTYVGSTKADVPSAYAGEEVTDYEYGEKIRLETPSAKGYVFAGWTTDQGDSVPAKMPDKDLTVIGQWKKSFTLTYFLYGNDGGPFMGGNGNALIGTKTQEFEEGEHALSELYTIKDFSVSYLFPEMLDGNMGGGFGSGYDADLLKDYIDGMGSAYLGWYLAPGGPNSAKAIERYPYFQALVQLNQETEQALVDIAMDILDSVELDKEPVIDSGMSISEIQNIAETWFYDPSISDTDKDILYDAFVEHVHSNNTLNNLMKDFEDERRAIMEAYNSDFYPELYDDEGNPLEPSFDFTTVTSINITEDLTLFGFYSPFMGGGEITA